MLHPLKADIYHLYLKFRTILNKDHCFNGFSRVGSCPSTRIGLCRSTKKSKPKFKIDLPELEDYYIFATPEKELFMLFPVFFWKGRRAPSLAFRIPYIRYFSNLDPG